MLCERKRLPTGNVPGYTFSSPRKAESTNFSEPNKLADQLLWAAFKKGDELAFIRIYKTYSAVLYHYGCKYSPDKELVRDCLQDFFFT